MAVVACLMCFFTLSRLLPCSSRSDLVASLSSGCDSFLYDGSSSVASRCELGAIEVRLATDVAAEVRFRGAMMFLRGRR